MITLIGLQVASGIAALVLLFAIAPSTNRAVDRQRDRVEKIATLEDLIEQRQAAFHQWTLIGDTGARADLDDLGTQIDAVTTELTGMLPADGRAALATVVAANRSFDTVIGRIDDAFQNDDSADGARGLAASVGVDAERQLHATTSALRQTFDDRSLDIGANATRLFVLLALGLLFPIAPTAWVNHQLRKGMRQIRDIAEDMLATSREVSSSASQLSAASEELAATSVEGAAAFTEALATIEELARAAESIASSADGVAVQSHDMRSNIEIAGGDIEESSERMLELAKRVDEIGGILVLMNEIADQTNLLAVNAAIEAARAGDGGKGFAVVAEEVRRLAERSKTSSARIGTIIESAQAETAATVMAMEKGANQMRHAMAFMDTVAEASAQGRLSAEQQRSATQQVVTTFSQLTGNTKTVSATTHQIATSAVGLANLAQELELTAASSAAGV